MKFMILALPILLAVGCQADSLQADAPSLLTYVEKGRVDMKMALEHMKDIASRGAEILKNIVDPDVKQIVESITTWTENIYNYLGSYQAQARDLIYVVVAKIDEATRDIRDAIHTDLENLWRELEPQRDELEEVVNKHIAEYRQILDQNIYKQNYPDEFQEQMATWRTKLEPYVEDLRTKIATNAEETKDKMIPIIEVIRTKMIERLQKLREDVRPYVEEFKEQMKQAYEQGQAFSMIQYTEKLTPHLDAVKTSFTNLVNEVKALAGM